MKWSKTILERKCRKKSKKCRTNKITEIDYWFQNWTAGSKRWLWKHHRRERVCKKYPIGNEQKKPLWLIEFPLLFENLWGAINIGKLVPHNIDYNHSIMHYLFLARNKQNYASVHYFPFNRLLKSTFANKYFAIFMKHAMK